MAEKIRDSGCHVHVDTSNNILKGGKPVIGAVLGTRTKKVLKKVPFDIFYEKLGNYILR